MRTVPTAYRHASKRCVVERRALRSGVDAREREGLAASGQPRLRRGAESDSIFVGTVGRNRHVLTAHPCAFAKKSPTGESPSRHPSTRTDENEPAGLFRVSARTRMGGRSVTTPNPAQKPRRGRRVSVPRPSRSLSRCEHTRINPHPPSPAIRPRGGAEGGAPVRTLFRGKRRGAFAPPCGVAHPLSRWRPPPRPRRRRNASRHVASSTSAATVITRRSPRVSPSPPSSLLLFPPGATRGAEVKIRLVGRERTSELQEVASRLVSRGRRDDVGDAPDEPPDSAGPRRPPDPPRRPGRRDRRDRASSRRTPRRTRRRRRPRRRGEGWCSATVASSTPRRAAAAARGAAAPGGAGGGRRRRRRRR